MFKAGDIVRFDDDKYEHQGDWKLLTIEYQETTTGTRVVAWNKERGIEVFTVASHQIYQS